MPHQPLQPIIQTTRTLLATVEQTDPIRECGRAALALLARDPVLCLRLAYQKLHDVPYRDVKACWRRLYADASLCRVLEVVERVGREGGDVGENREEDIGALYLYCG